MQKHCEHCQSLIPLFANEFRTIRGIVLENGQIDDLKHHIDSINQYCIDLNNTLLKIDCFFSTDDVLEVYDTIIATANDICVSVKQISETSAESLTNNDAQVKLQFSGLIREITQYLVELRNGLSQLSNKISVMKMAVLKPKLRGDFSSLIDILTRITDVIISKEFSSIIPLATQAKERMVSLCSKALEEGASNEDQKAIVVCFKEFVGGIAKLKNSNEIEESEIKSVIGLMDVFKRGIRSMSMGNPVVIKTNKRKEEEEENKRKREEEKRKLQEQIDESNSLEEKRKMEIENQKILVNEKLNQQTELTIEKNNELNKKIQLAIARLNEINTKFIIEKEDLEKLINEEKRKQINALEAQELKENIDNVMKEIKRLRIHKKHLENKLSNAKESKKIVRKPLNAIKGDFAKTIKRQRIMSKELPTKQLSAVEMRKQLEIDKTARELKQMSDESRPSVSEIAQTLQGLSETLDLDNIENSTDVYQILKQTDFNSIALRITSPKFRISSSISYIGHFVSDDEYDPENKEVTKMIEDYEKEAFYSLAEKASDIATTVEDMMCFGSLSVVAETKESTEDYLSDLLGSCKLAQNAVVVFMEAIPSIYQHGSECKGDDGLSQKYIEGMVKIPVPGNSVTSTKETIEFTYFYSQIIDRVRKQEFKPVIKQKYIEASLGLVASVSRKCIYQLINTNGNKIKSIVGQFLALSKCISHLKPKDFKYLQNNKKFDSKDFERECDKVDKDSKEQFQKELFYNVNIQRGYDLEILYMLEISALATDLINTTQDFIDAVHTVIAFKEKEEKLEVMGDSTPVAEEIAADTKLLKLKGDKVVSGSLNLMIYRFVTDYNSFKDQFFQSYQSFTKGSIVLSKIVSMYLGPNSLPPQIRTQSLIAIKHFVDECYYDLDSRSIVTVKNFISELKKRNEEKNVQALSAVLLRKQTELEHSIADSLVPPINFFVPQEAVSPSMLIQLSDCGEVARQLTLVASKLFNKIEKQELFNKSWSDESLFPQSMNVIRLLRHSETVCDWVCSSILLFFSVENRIKATIHFIQIAENLMKLNNFQSLFGIIKAFDVKSKISCLNIMDSLPSKYSKLYKQLCKVVDEKNDYKNYRQIVSKLNDTYVPLINVFLRDIEKFEEENPKTVKIGKVDVVNMKRYDVLAEMVKNFLKIRENTYSIPMVEPLSTFLNEMVNLSGKARDEIIGMWTKLL